MGSGKEQLPVSSSGHCSGTVSAACWGKAAPWDKSRNQTASDSQAPSTCSGHNNLHSGGLPGPSGVPASYPWAKDACFQVTSALGARPTQLRPSPRQSLARGGFSSRKRHQPKRPSCDLRRMTWKAPGDPSGRWLEEPAGHRYCPRGARSALGEGASLGPAPEWKPARPLTPGTVHPRGLQDRSGPCMGDVLLVVQRVDGEGEAR